MAHVFEGSSIPEGIVKFAHILLGTCRMLELRFCPLRQQALYNMNRRMVVLDMPGTQVPLDFTPTSRTSITEFVQQVGFQIAAIKIWNFEHPELPPKVLSVNFLNSSPTSS